MLASRKSSMNFISFSFCLPLLRFLVANPSAFGNSKLRNSPLETNGGSLPTQPRYVALRSNSNGGEKRKIKKKKRIGMRTCWAHLAFNSAEPIATCRWFSLAPFRHVIIANNHNNNNWLRWIIRRGHLTNRFFDRMDRRRKSDSTQKLSSDVLSTQSRSGANEKKRTKSQITTTTRAATANDEFYFSPIFLLHIDDLDVHFYGQFNGGRLGS